MASEVMVGVRTDGTIDVDISDDDRRGGDWNFNNLSLEQAKFLHEELGEAIQRCEKRSARQKAPPGPYGDMP